MFNLNLFIFWFYRVHGTYLDTFIAVIASIFIYFNFRFVSSGSFNGNLGSHFTPLTTTYYKLDIEWSPLSVFFYVNGVLLHKVPGGHLSNILTLPIVFENVNDNGSIVDVAFDCLGVVILREGELETNSTYGYIITIAETDGKQIYGARVKYTTDYI